MISRLFDTYFLNSQAANNLHCKNYPSQGPRHWYQTIQLISLISIPSYVTAIPKLYFTNILHTFLHFLIQGFEFLIWTDTERDQAFWYARWRVDVLKSQSSIGLLKGPQLPFTRLSPIELHFANSMDEYIEIYFMYAINMIIPWLFRDRYNT